MFQPPDDYGRAAEGWSEIVHELGWWRTAIFALSGFALCGFALLSLPGVIEDVGKVHIPVAVIVVFLIVFFYVRAKIGRALRRSARGR